MKLPPNISSPQDLVALLFELRAYSSWYAHNAVRHTTGSQQGAADMPPLSQTALELLKAASAGQLLDQKHLETLIAELNAFRLSAPTMTITLAAPAGHALKQTLAQWCRKNIDDSLLISFRFNATLLGGMVVRYGSHVFDWSFKRRLLAARATFPEVLRRV